MSMIAAAAAVAPEPDPTTDPGRPAARSRPRWHERRSLALGLLVVAACLVAFAYWPGHMSSDSFSMYSQALGREPLGDWHTPILVMLWRAVALVYQGVGLIMLAGVLGMAIGAYGVLRLAFGRVAAGALGGAVLFFPPVLSFVGVISRDVWFVDLMLLSVGALRLAHQRRHRGWLVAAGLCLWLALAARQNGVFAVIVLAAALLGVNRALRQTAGYVPRHRRGRRPAGEGAAAERRGGRVGTALWRLMAPGLLVTGFVISQFAIIAIAPVQSLHPEQAVYIYDLAALSVRNDEILLDPEVFPSQDLEQLEAAWNPNDLGGLLFSQDPMIRFWLGADTVAELRDDWLDAVLEHPDDWARIRGDVFRRQSAIGQPSLWVTHPGIDPNGFGIHLRFTEAHEVLEDYLDPFIVDANNDGTALFSPFYYGIAGLVVALVGLRRHPRRNALAAWLGFAVVVYTLTPLAPTTGATYRYSYFTVVGGLVCAVVLLGWLVQLVRRPAAAEPMADAAVHGP